ncbi:DUF3046 domain-containing protein [Actinotalea subterranea]|uniref:DUF3046 domain-containing protein n=1 Tax=Actinotalea subterranea TaxID=2607497 RepID=UPI0011EFB4AA|nr:DUF3046 domain-containing protein [Actinotalea subterranea]
MRYSEFRELVADVFGAELGRTLVRDLVLGDLEDRTSEKALEAGVEPALVWRALCDAMAVPAAERWGSQLRTPRRR